MDYSGIINRAFNLAWKHKIFWVMGFFAASWGYLGSIEDSFPNLSRNWSHYSWEHNFNFDYHIIENIKDWMTSGPGIAVGIVIIGFFMLIGLVLFILHIISAAGLIDGVVRVKNGDSHKLKELFQTGTRYFWQFLGLFFLFVLIGVIIFALMIVPLILSIIAFQAFGLLFLLIMLPLAFIAAFLMSNIYSLAQREIIINGVPVFEAVREAFKLLRNNLGPNIIIFLITSFLWIAIIIGAFILTLIFAIPALIIGSWSMPFMIIALVIILPLFLAIAIVVEGFLGTFFSALFTYFYLELRRKNTVGEINNNPDILSAN